MHTQTHTHTPVIKPQEPTLGPYLRTKSLRPLPHIYTGALTIIMQDKTAALEVYSGTKQDNGDGEWVPVDPVAGALTINTGDMLMVWSNGRFKVSEVWKIILQLLRWIG